MEKILSPEEKIKKAEEIYYRRKHYDLNDNYARVNVNANRKDYKLFKKMILQFLICSVIYSVFYMIINTDYFFSEGVVNKTKEVLNYDIDFNNLYNKINKYFQNEDYSKLDENNIDNPQKENDNSLIEDNNEVIDNGIDNITVTDSKEENIENENNLTQMEQDAKEILSEESFVLPLKGTITSRFGPRTSDNPIVSAYHTGIDIAVNEGTIFVCAMEGTVEEVSTTRRIRKSFKNSEW